MTLYSSIKVGGAAAYSPPGSDVPGNFKSLELLTSLLKNVKRISHALKS